MCNSSSVDLGRRGVGDLSITSPCSTGLAKVPSLGTFDPAVRCFRATGSNVGILSLRVKVGRGGVSLGRAKDRWWWKVVHPELKNR